MVPRKQAGHMTCTRPQAERQILLAMRAASTHDPLLISDFGRILLAVIAMGAIANCGWSCYTALTV
jgi:hypothetical protein